MRWQKYGCPSPLPHGRCAGDSFPLALDIIRIGEGHGRIWTQDFSADRAIRILTISFGIFFAVLLLWSSYSARKPDEWWVPYLFLVFVVPVPFMYPAVLTIEVDGIASRTWFGSEKKIRWEEIASLHHNTGSKQFSVRDKVGRKITHSGFNADAGMFLNEIRERTRLPLTIARPGTWKTETIEGPFEEIEADSDERA